MKRIKDIPSKYHNMVQPLKNPEPDKADFEFIVPSGQFWNDLTIEEQNELRKIVKDEGQDLDTYLYQMRRMLPLTPKGH